MVIMPCHPPSEVLRLQQSEPSSRPLTVPRYRQSAFICLPTSQWWGWCPLTPEAHSEETRIPPCTASPSIAPERGLSLRAPWDVFVTAALYLSDHWEDHVVPRDKGYGGRPWFKSRLCHWLWWDASEAGHTNCSSMRLWVQKVNSVQLLGGRLGFFCLFNHWIKWLLVWTDWFEPEEPNGFQHTISLSGTQHDNQRSDKYVINFQNSLMSRAFLGSPDFWSYTGVRKCTERRPRNSSFTSLQSIVSLFPPLVCQPKNHQLVTKGLVWRWILSLSPSLVGILMNSPDPTWRVNRVKKRANKGLG